jgi:hypothetical protein
MHWRRSLGLALVVVAVVASPAAAAPVETIAIDEMFYRPATSAACGFDVWQHDVGEVKIQSMVLPDGTVRTTFIAVRIATSYVAPSEGTTVYAPPGARGPFTETVLPDGTVETFARGHYGRVRLGNDVLFEWSGNSRGWFFTDGTVVWVSHGPQSPDTSEICPLLISQ